MAFDVSELTRTTRLLFVLVIEVDLEGRLLAVAHLWSTDDDFQTILATNSLDVNIKVQFTHSGDDRLRSFFVSGDAESWIFFTETLKSFTKLLTGTSVSRGNRNRDHRISNEHIFQSTVLGFFGVRFT